MMQSCKQFITSKLVLASDVVLCCKAAGFINLVPKLAQFVSDVSSLV